MDIIKALTEELGIARWQTQAAVDLIDGDNTIPFISRYRKEATGSLNDEVLRRLHERLLYLRNLEQKKEQVIGSISEQGLLSPELERQIQEAATLVAVEDLYRPYRPKRRTRATIARERGLGPLADAIWAQELTGSLSEEARRYVDPERDVADVEAALAGAMDVISERISDDAAYRTAIRTQTLQKGSLVCTAKDPAEKSVYEQYYDYQEALSKIPGHRVLAINRGEKEKILSVKVELSEEPILRFLQKQIIHGRQPDVTAFLTQACQDSYKRLIQPSIEREIRSMLTEQAEEGAIRVFGKNLRQILMQPPIANQVVLGWDPAFRTGCKLAVVDATGKVLDTTVIFPTPPQSKVAEAKKTLTRLIKKYHVTLISLGNGTASRESEAVITELIRELDVPLSYVIVSEAGASVYSASKLATEEFPDFDVAQRSAVSIARRLQDPLAELVKIEPKAIGVGQYQHDMNQKKLEDTLGGVVEDCVNSVGVDLNTASASLLEYVSGISKTIAKNIVSYREETGAFTNRKQLLSVSKLGPKAFQQCAGFLRISGGDNPLDNTSVHPESYELATSLLQTMGFSLEDVGNRKGLTRNAGDLDKLAERFHVGAITLKDVLEELEKPSRDPREDMPKPILRTDVLEISDLKEGMILKGTVRNVIDFGVFVDIGVHQDGLVHVSQITDRFIKHPLDVLSIGDVVEVKILSVDVERKRIGLTMRF